MYYTSNISIFSDEVGAGKTTTLMHWAKKQKGIGGILSPKIEGKRFFLDLNENELRPMENENGVFKIGQFSFDENQFQWAEDQILKAFKSVDNRTIIIDEIGPLEIKKNQGFHQLLLHIFEENEIGNPKIIIVVRDFLVEEFIEKYKLDDAKILPKNFFKDQHLSALNALVLAGGKSKRMKTDKALLSYDDVPQWEKVKKFLNPFSEKTLISINQKQAETWCSAEQSEFVIDDENATHLGPLNGIFSATKRFPKFGLMISAIDYPKLRLQDFIALQNAREQGYEGVFYEYESEIEPLIGILEREAFPKLQSFIEKGGNSFKKFLESIKIKKIIPKDLQIFTNINTLEEWESYRRDDRKN